MNRSVPEIMMGWGEPVHPKVTLKNGLAAAHWRSNTEEATDCECADCGVSINGCIWANHIFPDDASKKTYFFYVISEGKKTYTMSGLSNTGGVGGSQTVEAGTALVKMLRKDGESHRCLECFMGRHNLLFRSITASLNSQALFLNATSELIKPKIGGGK